MRRAVFLAAMAALPGFAAAAPLQPGLYRSTSQAVGKKPETSDDCITQNHVKGKRIGACKE